MKQVNVNAIFVFGITLVLAFLLEGCVVMYKVQGVDAKDPKEVKLSGPEYKGKTS